LPEAAGPSIATTTLLDLVMTNSFSQFYSRLGFPD
jgi:hypothetical protein